MSETTPVLTVTIALDRHGEGHPLSAFARRLRSTCALNHGRTVIRIRNPDGTEDLFSVYAGCTTEEHRHVLESYNWSHH